MTETSETTPPTASGPQTGSERLRAIADRTRAELAWLEANNRGADHIVMGRALTVGDLRTLLLACEECRARDAVYAAADQCRNAEDCKAPCLCTRVTAELLAAAARRRAAPSADGGGA